MPRVLLASVAKDAAGVTRNQVSLLQVKRPRCVCVACGAPHLLICSSEVITRSNLIPVFGFGLPWGSILMPQDVPCPCDI